MNETPENNKECLQRPVKILLISAGTFFVGLGIFGIFVPMLPTTPFLLVAAALYARSSRKFYNWLTSNRLFGRIIKNYRDGKGIPLKVKILTIALLWTTITVSAIFATDILWIRIILVLIATGVTLHIALTRTYEY